MKSVNWVLVRLRRKSKMPIQDAWPELDEKPRHGENVGVHMARSGLIDIDLDCDEAVRLADEFLDPSLSFGREGLRTHILYSGKGSSHVFRDPWDDQDRPKARGKVLVEIRCNLGQQTMIPPSVHPSGSVLEWLSYDLQPLADEGAVGRLAAACWVLRHPDAKSVPAVVQSWAEGTWRQTTSKSSPASRVKVPVVFDQIDEGLIERIVECCPDHGRHDYRLAIAGTLHRQGFSEQCAEEMLRLAMADPRLGDDRRDAVKDASISVSHTYHTSRNTYGAATLIEMGLADLVDDISSVVTPTFRDLDVLEELLERAVGGSIDLLSDEKLISKLAKLQMKKDSRLPGVWVALKDAAYQYTRDLKEIVKLRADELRAASLRKSGDATPLPFDFAKGLVLPPGYSVEFGALHYGESHIMHGELLLLAKCPSEVGVHVRIAFRSPSNPKWRFSVVPYRSVVDARGILCLAEHGCNISSLETQALVGYVRDYVVANEQVLDRPIATQTGWHESGAFVWGRTVLGAEEDSQLEAEFPADNQIAIKFADALRSGGSREESFAALRVAVEHLPAVALCIAASLAASWVRLYSRPNIGVHLAGMGGKGKTRTLKIAGSVWGRTGGAASLSANGVIAGANTTQRALEVAASVRGDLPLLISDVRPSPGLPEILHSVLNGDARARATASGGATLGESYRAGALITEGELNVLALTTRQGFHRRMLELPPDDNTSLIWSIGELCSTHYGHLGPLFVTEGDIEQRRVSDLQEVLLDALGYDFATMGASLIASAECAAQMIGADANKWIYNILKAIGDDRAARTATGITQIDRLKEDLAEILVALSPYIADSQASSDFCENGRAWVGFRDGSHVYVICSALKSKLREAGHDAIQDAVNALGLRVVQRRVTRARVRCYRIRIPK